MSEKRKTVKEEIMDLLRRSKKPLRVREICKMTKLNYNTVRGRLQELRKEGLVKREEDGWIII